MPESKKTPWNVLACAGGRKTASHEPQNGGNQDHSPKIGIHRENLRFQFLVTLSNSTAPVAYYRSRFMARHSHGGSGSGSTHSPTRPAFASSCSRYKLRSVT